MGVEGGTLRARAAEEALVKVREVRLALEVRVVSGGVGVRGRGDVLVVEGCACEG